MNGTTIDECKGHQQSPQQSPRRGKRLLAAVGAVAAILGMGLPGCGKGDTAGGDKGTTVGFIYVGTRDDYGYNEAHADGAAEVKKVAGVKLIENEKILETMDCQQAMESMINQKDATMIFATSFGYFHPHVEVIAAKYPKITFLHAGGHFDEGKTPANIGTYFAYIDELEYLCGIAAGLTTKSNKLGYIAAKPITPVLRDINAFELGAKSVNPKATTTVIFTGDWFLPNEEANAVTNLADQGVDVVTGHVDSPKVLIETANKRGLYSCGYHYNGSKLSPEKYLTGAEWNWGPMYVKFVEDFKAGKPMPKNFMGTIRDGAVKLSPYGPAVSDATKKAVDDVKAKMMKGEFKMYVGPIKNNKGKVIEGLEDGKSVGDEDGLLWKMDYLVEGVIGSTGK